MRLLVLGGTAFLGRSLVEEALRRGHAVTTFNRGRTGPDVPGVEAIRGDRAEDADLQQLSGCGFDAVVDTSGFVPEVVGRSARLLTGDVETYAFVSSLSAAGWPGQPITADTPGLPCPADAGPEAGDYGELKAGCERAVEAAFGDRALIVRSGLILGPYENVGRLPWWLRRIARGGQVLAPGDPTVLMQLIDARDLAAWILDCVAAGVTGSFPATSEPAATTYGGLLMACREATGSDAELVWVHDSALLAHGVEPWTELPLWHPEAAALHFWDVDVSAAHAHGLRCRPVAETVADTWAWLRAADAVVPPRSGLPPIGLDAAKERRILDAFTAGR